MRKQFAEGDGFSMCATRTNRIHAPSCNNHTRRMRFLDRIKIPSFHLYISGLLVHIRETKFIKIPKFLLVYQWRKSQISVGISVEIHLEFPSIYFLVLYLYIQLEFPSISGISVYIQLEFPSISFLVLYLYIQLEFPSISGISVEIQLEFPSISFLFLFCIYTYS